MSHAAPPKEVVSIQQLRGLAAMLVVLHHASAAAPWLFSPLANSTFGESGVDIFFVISGFIMVVAARGETVREFWLKRIVRIAPLYWLATLTFVAIRLPHFGEPDLTVGAVIKSLLFIPYRIDPTSWKVAPVLVPGWSLNIEMFFYLLFGLGLAVKRPALFSGILVCLAVIAGFIFQPANAILFSFSRPILLEFACGLALGSLYLSGRLPARLWPLLFIGLAIIFSSDLLDEETRRAVRGIGGILVVTGALALEIGGTVRNLPFARAIGDGSYAIYLFHTMILMMLRKVFPHVPLSGWPQFLAFIFVSLILSAVGGYIVHRFVERPLTVFARRLVLPRRQATVPAEWVDEGTNGGDSVRRETARGGIAEARSPGL
ncbi:MAG TPA: acyltransferase [Sphingobium sp.]|uniref:acyltransferase family protein n=1 Tax=Sphingobium sp. TaxID=1912891 RepID=UPI002ED06A0C